MNQTSHRTAWGFYLTQFGSGRMPKKAFTYLDDDAKLGALAGVPVGSDVVLQAAGKLAWGWVGVFARVYGRENRGGVFREK